LRGRTARHESQIPFLCVEFGLGFSLHGVATHFVLTVDDGAPPFDDIRENAKID
jgi:hypothetical protein